MSAEQCEHVWGDVEEVELGIGIVHSPLCKHCGAVKLEVGRRVAERRRQDWIDQNAVAPKVAHSRRESFEESEAAESLPPLGFRQESQGRLAL